ncbi:MAG: hypothetical protein ACLUIW_04960 [Dysosmobacter welbionis]
MLRRKLAESLTVRIFLLTFLLLLGAGGLTFALIAWATPITYTAVISDRLQAQVADLTQQLAQTNLADAGPILDAFVRESGAEVALTGPRRGGGGHRLPVGPAGGGLAGSRHHVRGGQLGPDL